MNYRSSILIVCLATLGLAIDGWGQGWDKIAFYLRPRGGPQHLDHECGWERSCKSNQGTVLH